ncbi:MAG: leucine-rich repeat protein [Saccharofermentanales bacterium]
MKRKLYLRIQAFALVLLMMLTTFIVNPQQVQAETATATEDELISDVNTAQEIEESQVAAETEITPDVVNNESQDDLEQTDVEAETMDILPESDSQENSETDNVPKDESSDVADIPEIEADTESFEPAVEPTADEDINSSESLSEQALDQADESEQEEEDINQEDEKEQNSDIDVTDSTKDINTRATNPESDFEFDPGKGEITGYRGTKKVVNIPSIINGVEVSRIGASAFKDKGITEVTIPNSVKWIGVNAFANNQLTSITIPNSVTKILHYAFAKNQLTSVTLSNSLDFLSGFNNNKLTSIRIPDSVTGIGPYAFDNNQLTSVVIPNRVIRLGSHSFSNNQLKKVTIPNSVTTIDFDIFYNNQLTSVTIPNSVTSIGEGTFKENPITHASIPASIKTLTRYNSANHITNPTIAQMQEYCFDPGIALYCYVKAGSNIRKISDGKPIETLKMPIYVTGTIDGNYFKFTHKGQAAYVYLNLITASPQAITGYAKSAVNVRNASGGSVIGTIPKGHRVQGVLVGNRVRFTYNNQTGYVYVSLLQGTPVKVTTYIKANSIIRSAPNGSIITKTWRPLFVSGTIDGAWLRFTYNGRTAYVAMSVTTTQSQPITGYTKSSVNVRSAPSGSVIGSLPIGRKVTGTLVGNWVKFTYSGKTGYIYASLLQANPVRSTRYVKVGSNIRSTPGGAIIEKLKTPIYVTGTIQGNYLKFTHNNKTAYVHLNVTTSIPVSPESDFETEDFYGKLTITGYRGTNKVVNIPSSIGGVPVERIDDFAFKDKSLTAVIIPDSVETIGFEAFANNKITSVIIPNSVNRIKQNAFYNNQLTSVTIPDSVTVLGLSAFQSNKLTRVRIPDSINKVESRYGYSNIINPYISHILAVCFDPEVSLIYDKLYIKAGTTIRKEINREVMTKTSRPLYVEGLLAYGCFFFEYDGLAVYVAKADTTTSSPSISGYAENTVNVRNKPGGSIIGTLSIGRKVTGVLVGNWVKFTYSGKTGYIHASLLQENPVKVTRYIKAGSNIRSTPTGTVIEKLTMPIYVTGTIQGNYLKFTHKGKTAYAHLSVTTTKSPLITGYTKSRVNVRYSPYGNVRGSLSANRRVSGVLVENWVKFNFEGNTGYVYASYIK